MLGDGVASELSCGVGLGLTVEGVGPEAKGTHPTMRAATTMT